MMRIGLTYDLQTDPADARQAEFDPPRTIGALKGALEALGHQVVPLGSAAAILEERGRLTTVDLVFNIAEGSHGRCREAWVPALLECLNVPYVGSGPAALAVGLDKALTKRLAAGCGVPTPRWLVVEDPAGWDGVTDLRFPAIVKPRYEGSGLGIDEGAVVGDAAALAARLRQQYGRAQQPLLVEEFVGHGELTVCLIGNDPPVAYPAIQRPIDSASRLAYHVAGSSDRKWDAPLALTDALDTAARRLAVTMFQAVGCRDMARADLRVDAAGGVWFLEINPLPSFDPEGSFGLLADYLSVGYHDLIGRIVDAAQRRLAPQRGAFTR
ncbi:MAG: D-alanine--D-alanine ligase [Candidatus Omnitrophica bacterium]|nr:D-alanine--D-alanine ligase [Candidatus Omnitrophota bacterium]